MDSYGFLAEHYDALTADVDYLAWADYLEKLFARSKQNIHSVVDLACGTGSLTVALSQRGYQVIGVDLSEDMLSVAANKCAQLSNPPLLLCQDMSRLSLMVPVDAVVCCLDSLNYIIHPKAVQKTFSKVFQALQPGGLFIFDIRTPLFLQNMDGQVFLDETENVYCVWQGSFSAKRNILTYAMDLFVRESAQNWTKYAELHEEYSYQPDQLAQWLAQAGFHNIKQYGCLKLRTPQPDEERIFFVAYKGD